MKLRFATLLLVLCTALPARAEGSRFGFELAFHTQQAVTALGLMLEADLQASDTVLVALQAPVLLGGADVSVAFGTNRADSPSVQAGLGNPALAVLYRSQSDDFAYTAGAGLTLPLASNPDTSTPEEFSDALADALIRSAAAGAYGMRDLWLWSVDHLTLFAPVTFERRTPAHLLLLADATLALMLPVRDRADLVSDDLDVAVQLRVGLGAHAESIEGGAAFGLVAVPTQDGDVTQIALEPFVRFKFSGGYVDTRLVVNLDKPYGFAFDDGQVWGLLLGAGVLL